MGHDTQIYMNDTSDIHDLENGCPQGSVLSPILFNVIINTLDDALGDVPNLSLSQFAIDCAIWTKHSSPRLVLNKIQSALDEIETLKNKAIIFSRRKTNIGSLQKLTLFGRDIEFSDQITFLGMTLDKKLTWGEHIKKLIEKCNKDLNLMRLTYQVPHMGRIRKSFSPSIRH